MSQVYKQEKLEDVIKDLEKKVNPKSKEEWLMQLKQRMYIVC